MKDCAISFLFIGKRCAWMQKVSCRNEEERKQSRNVGNEKN